MTSSRSVCRRLFVLALFSLALITLGAPAALADTVSFDLSFGNAPGLTGYTGPYVHVVATVTGAGTATFTFTSLTNGGFTYLMTDGGAAAINLASITGVSASATITNSNAGFFNFNAAAGPISCTVAAGQNNDGFGDFNVKCTNFDGYQASGDTIVVTLTGGSWGAAATVASILLANGEGPQGGSVLSAHVGAWDGASTGFATTGFAGDKLCNTCNGTDGNPIPEPTTITMLGSGLLAVAFGIRRRWNNQSLPDTKV